MVSHGDVTQATDPLEAWVYWRNLSWWTKRPRRLIPDARHRFGWHTRVWLMHHFFTGSCIWQIHLKTARKATQDQTIVTISKVPRAQVVEEVVRVAQVPETWTLPEKMFARHGKSNVEAVHNWWSAIGSQVMGGTGNLSCVAGLQLFLDFYLTTQHQGPWVFKKRWYDAEQHVPVGGRLPWVGG